MPVLYFKFFFFQFRSFFFSVPIHSSFCCVIHSAFIYLLSFFLIFFNVFHSKLKLFMTDILFITIFSQSFQCGLLLASVMILFYGYLTKKTCEYLLRASSASRKPTLEQIGKQFFWELAVDHVFMTFKLYFVELRHSNWLKVRLRMRIKET